MIALTPKGARWYTPESEKAAVIAARAEKPPRTVTPTEFQIRDLTQAQRIELYDSVRVFVGDGDESNSVSTGVGTRTQLALATCLVGVKNLQDGAGNNVPFVANPEGGAADEFLERLPWSAQKEIAEEIQAAAMMEESEVEKSEPSQED